MLGLGASGRRPAAQAVRTAVFAVLATALALGAHVAAGAAPPTAGPVLLAVLVTATAGSLLASGAPSVPRAVATLGAVQALAHHLFMTGPADGHPMPHGVAGTGVSPPMLAAHALVVLATAWMLVRGEEAVAALVARAAVRLPGALPLLTPEAALRPVPCAVLVPAHGRVVTSHLLLRGPPEGRVAVA